jgi:hypothetical protein
MCVPGGLLLTLMHAVARAATCASYGEAESVTEVRGATLEASGLAASRSRPGVFFAHGDKNDAAVFVSFDQGGALLGEHLVTDATNEDWEDIASAPCPDRGECLYIGDIGDNDEDRAEVVVWVVREPNEGDSNVRSIARWVGTYPDGPHDAEALMVHPCTGAVYLVTKEESGRSGVYKFPPFPEGVVTLEEVAEVDVSGGAVAESLEVTGGDWDAEGERVLLRTSDRFFEWATDPDRPDAHWLDEPLVLIGTNHPLGEGVAYGDDGAFFAIGEGTPIPMDRYRCEDLTPAQAVCEFPQTGGCGCAGSPVAPAGWLAPLLAVAWRRRAAGRRVATAGR